MLLKNSSSLRPINNFSQPHLPSKNCIFSKLKNLVKILPLENKKYHCFILNVKNVPVHYYNDIKVTSTKY
jgi:hypothetical protein